MHRTLNLCRGGLTAAAAFVLLTACSGDTGNNEDAAASSSSESTSSSAENTAPEADSEFCTQAQSLTTALEGAFDQQASDPAAVAQQFQQTATAVRSIEAPAEIATDWENIASGLEQFAAAFSQYNPSDPASASAFAQQTTELQTLFATSGANVERYLSEQCGIAPDPTETAAPTS